MKNFAIFIMGCLLFPLASLAAPDRDGFQLTSSAFENNGDIPRQYTCQGANINPPLTFKNVPPQAKSLVLTVSDPDAPLGRWSHWVIYNIPPDTTEILENTGPGTEGLNDFGKYAYGGPCPPNGLHHYIFSLYALNIALTIEDRPTLSEIEKAIRGHVIAQTGLVGLYQRGGW